jgi:predicted nucleotidyltransferase
VSFLDDSQDLLWLIYFLWYPLACPSEYRDAEHKLDLDRTAVIAGLKIKVIRDAIHEMARHDMNDDGWTVIWLANHMTISPTHAEWLSETLVEQKILQRKPPPSWDKSPTPQIRYVLGEYGTRFTLARMLKRIDRVKVDNVIAGLLKRVAEINANPDLCYFVNEIRLFGSAMHGRAESFGDVDIAYDFGRRKRPSDYNWHDWSRKRWKLAGRHNLNFLQQLCYSENEVMRLLKARNQYLSIHNFDDMVGIGAESTRLYIMREDQIELEDGISGEKLHEARMVSAKERAEKKEQWAAGKLLPTICSARSPEQIKQEMITAVKSLAFDLFRAVEEHSPQEALEQSITVAQKRIEAYRELNTRDRIPEILRDALSVDIIEQSEPKRFVFSEERVRYAMDGTDKKALAHRQVTHAVLKKLKQWVVSGQPLGNDDHYYGVEDCFHLRREADVDEYRYRIEHPKRRYTHDADFLSETALATLRQIAKRANERLHKQALKTLSDRNFIKAFRNKWRLTPDGEWAIKYHAEKDAFHAQSKAG